MFAISIVGMSVEPLAAVFTLRARARVMVTLPAMGLRGVRGVRAGGGVVACFKT